MLVEYLTIGRTNGIAKNSSPYCILKLVNADETISVAVWDVDPTAGPQIGQLVRFHNITDRDGKKSAGVRDMVTGPMCQEGHPLYDLIPRPIKREVWDKTLQNLIAFSKHPRLIAVIREFGEKLYEPYSKYPAATAMHHAFPGGLLNHTWQMLHMLEGLYPVLPYPQSVHIERCILACLFHDYGKLCEYNRDGETQEDMYLLGHIFISAHTLQNVLEEKFAETPGDTRSIKPENREEIKRIIHCVLAHHGEKEFGSPVVPCSQEAIIVNMVDNLSAKTENAETTGNMEYSACLGTHVIKD